MKLDFVAHLSLEVPDELIMQLKEAQIPGLLRLVLADSLQGEPLSQCIPIVEGAPPVPMALGAVEWRADYVNRLLRQIRQATENARVLGESDVQHNSIICRNSARNPRV